MPLATVPILLLAFGCFVLAILLMGIGTLTYSIIFDASSPVAKPLKLAEVVLAGFISNGVMLAWATGIGMPIRVTTIALVCGGTIGIAAALRRGVVAAIQTAGATTRARVAFGLTAVSVTAYLAVHVRGREAGMPFGLGVDQFGFAGFAVWLFEGNSRPFGWLTSPATNILASKVDFTDFIVQLNGSHAARWVASASVAQGAQVLGAERALLTLGSVVSTWVLSLAAALWWTFCHDDSRGEKRTSWVDGGVLVACCSPLLFHQYAGLGNWGALATAPLVLLAVSGGSRLGRPAGSGDRLTDVGFALCVATVAFTYVEAVAFIFVSIGVASAVWWVRFGLRARRCGVSFGRAVAYGVWHTLKRVVFSLGWIFLVLVAGWPALFHAVIAIIAESGSAGWPQPRWVLPSDMVGLTDVFVGTLSYDVASHDGWAVGIGGFASLAIICVLGARKNRHESLSRNGGLLTLFVATVATTIVSGGSNYSWSRVATLGSVGLTSSFIGGVRRIGVPRSGIILTPLIIFMTLANLARSVVFNTSNGSLAGRSTWNPNGCIRCADFSDLAWVTDPNLDVRGFLPALAFHYVWINGPNMNGPFSDDEVQRIAQRRVGLVVMDETRARRKVPTPEFVFRPLASLGGGISLHETLYVVADFIDEHGKFDYEYANMVLFWRPQP